jgi:hypothetical protein
MCATARSRRRGLASADPASAVDTTAARVRVATPRARQPHAIPSTSDRAVTRRVRSSAPPPGTLRSAAAKLPRGRGRPEVSQQHLHLVVAREDVREGAADRVAHVPGDRAVTLRELPPARPTGRGCARRWRPRCKGRFGCRSRSAGGRGRPRGAQITLSPGLGEGKRPLRIRPSGRAAGARIGARSRPGWHVGPTRPTNGAAYARPARRRLVTTARRPELDRAPPGWFTEIWFAQPQIRTRC